MSKRGLEHDSSTINPEPKRLKVEGDKDKITEDINTSTNTKSEPGMLLQNSK